MHILAAFEVLEIMMGLPFRNFRFFFVCYTSFILGLSSGIKVFYQDGWLLPNIHHHVLSSNPCLQPNICSNIQPISCSKSNIINQSDMLIL